MRYVTELHRRFESGGVPFVYVSPSASILALDGVSASVLDHFAAGADLEEWVAGRNGDEEFREQYEVFEGLVHQGLLKPEGEVGPVAEALPPMPYPLTTLVLNVTNKCNLACTYCYEFGEDKLADALRKNGDKRRSRMSSETAQQSIDFLMENSTGRDQVNLTFFGGETLLNFETIRDAVLYAKERATECGKRMGFALTTNATLLTDEIIDFLVEHRFGVNVSIDGGSEEQDRHRTFKSGEGTYEEIAPRIQRLIAANSGVGQPIGARVTLTEGAASVRDTYEHLVGELGFDQVGFAPVTSAPGRDYALASASMDALLDDFRVLTEDYVEAAIENKRHGFSNIEDLLRELHQGVNKAHPCGAGLGLLGVSTEGDLGLCHRFVESGEHEVGDVESGIDQEKRQQFLIDGHISNKAECQTCFARPHCSGGCYHEAEVRYGDASHPNVHHCDWVRAWTDLGLEAYGKIAVGNPAFLDRLDGDPGAPVGAVMEVEL